MKLAMLYIAIIAMFLVSCKKGADLVLPNQSS